MIKILRGGTRGYVLLDCLLAVLVSSFVGAVLLGIFATALTYWEFVAEVRAAWVKSERIFLVIESRVVNAGLDFFPQIFVEDYSLLPGWENALEILDSDDKLVTFQTIGGEKIARGERMRVLSASLADCFISSDAWKPGASMDFKVPIVPRRNHISSWWTAPSLGIPFRAQAKYITNPSSETWRGVDRLHTFRIAYFHAIEYKGDDVFYIRDSTESSYPGALNKEPIANGVTAASFELNKTKKTLTAWVSVSTSRSSKKAREISRTWKIRNY